MGCRLTTGAQSSKVLVATNRERGGRGYELGVEGDIYILLALLSTLRLLAAKPSCTALGLETKPQLLRTISYFIL